MSKKDFELIARVLRAGRETLFDAYDLAENGEAVDAHDNTARLFADELAATNPRFKRDLFLRACGVES